MYLLIAVKPTAKTLSTMPAIRYPDGAPIPPIMMAIGAMPAITVSGAAAATTKNTMSRTPRAPRSRRSWVPVDVDMGRGLLRASTSGIGKQGDGVAQFGGRVAAPSVGSDSAEPGSVHRDVGDVRAGNGGWVRGEVDEVRA